MIRLYLEPAPDVGQAAQALEAVSKKRFRKSTAVAVSKIGKRIKERVRETYSKELAQRVKLSIATWRRLAADVFLKRVQEVRVPKRRFNRVSGRYLALARVPGKEENKRQAVAGHFAANVEDQTTTLGGGLKGLFSRAPGAKYRMAKSGKMGTYPIKMYHRLIPVPTTDLKDTAHQVIGEAWDHEFRDALDTGFKMAANKT